MGIQTDLQTMLNKIQGLINSSEDPSYPDDLRASYAVQAQRLMKKYRVQEEELIAQDPFKVEVGYTEVDLFIYPSEFPNEYFRLFARSAEHAEIRYVTRYMRDAEGREVYRALCVGYDVDLRMAEYLFAAARLAFSEHLEPKPKSDLSEAENVYRLRRAGVERNKIANLMWGAPLDSRGQSQHGKVAKIYKAECARRGETAALNGRQVNAKTYREVYAKTFVREFTHRLRVARDAADSMAALPDLHGRQERVEEAFYAKFPSAKPKAVESGQAPQVTAPKSRRRKMWTAADEANYQRMTNSPAAVAGKRAGQDAAASVEIARDHEKVKRVEEAPEDQEARQLMKEIQGW